MSLKSWWWKTSACERDPKGQLPERHSPSQEKNLEERKRKKGNVREGKRQSTAKKECFPLGLFLNCFRGRKRSSIARLYWGKEDFDECNIKKDWEKGRREGGRPLLQVQKGGKDSTKGG